MRAMAHHQPSEPLGEWTPFLFDDMMRREILPRTSTKDRLRWRVVSRFWRKGVPVTVQTLPTGAIAERWISHNIYKFVNLSSLDLANACSVTDVALACLPNLTSLGLANNSVITDLGLQGKSSLRILCLENNSMITDAGLSCLPGLTSLNLANNQLITDSAMRGLGHLTTLDLKKTKNISNAGVRMLSCLTSLN